MEYDVALEKSDGKPMEVHSALRPRLLVGAPADLGGSDVWWSPEHLLVAALATCLTATFSALAERAELHFGEVRCRARGTLDRKEGHIAFSSMHVAMEITVLARDVERTRAVAEDAKNRCFVAGSLRCPIELVVDVKAT